MHSTKYEKLDYRSIPVFESIQVFPIWQTNSLGVTNEKAPKALGYVFLIDLCMLSTNLKV